MIKFISQLFNSLKGRLPSSWPCLFMALAMPAVTHAATEYHAHKAALCASEAAGNAHVPAGNACIPAGNACIPAGFS